jgi:hypothetical protein
MIENNGSPPVWILFAAAIIVVLFGIFLWIDGRFPPFCHTDYIDNLICDTCNRTCRLVTIVGEP